MLAAAMPKGLADHLNAPSTMLADRHALRRRLTQRDSSRSSSSSGGGGGGGGATAASDAAAAAAGADGRRHAFTGYKTALGALLGGPTHKYDEDERCSQGLNHALLADGSAPGGAGKPRWKSASSAAAASMKSPAAEATTESDKGHMGSGSGWAGWLLGSSRKQEAGQRKRRAGESVSLDGQEGVGWAASRPPSSVSAAGGS